MRQQISSRCKRVHSSLGNAHNYNLLRRSNKLSRDVIKCFFYPFYSNTGNQEKLINGLAF